MEIYLVGGAVRDAMLGFEGSDRDWVVVGATPEAMVAQGFQPVGKDFPVFLHPVTHEEYALARTERKTAPGYRGFVVHADPGVTLAQDLSRRDLTINAMARASDGTLIDPYGGAHDVSQRVLRHVTEAFREDPVRILRLARFAARFPDFSVAEATQQLMQDMVAHGEVDALVSERVWQELSRGLLAPRPSRLLQVLHDCGALARLVPEWGDALALHEAIDEAARQQAPLAIRWAVVCHRLSNTALNALHERLRVPVPCRELAEMLVREQTALRDPAMPPPQEVLALLHRCDAMRRPERLQDLFWAMTVLQPQGRLRALGAQWLRAALGVSSAEISQAALAEGLKGPAIGARIDAARLDALQRASSASGE
jgi:tRNA nucleotidyltransferase (CCA-adding enzyme)